MKLEKIYRARGLWILTTSLNFSPKKNLPKTLERILDREKEGRR